MKAIIFGANGQDGYYLHHLLQRKGIESLGISRSGDWIHGDVSDYRQVEKLIKQHMPMYVFHLAAKSTTRHDALFENHETISTGALNVLEAVRLHAPGAKVFLAGSGLQFKNTGFPISENDTFEADNAYAVSRIHSVYAARYYRTLGVKAYVGYLFHHESPLRSTGHVSRLIVDAVNRIADGCDECIELGDICVEKEWTFAGDVVKAILVLVEQEEVFEAAIGSGVGYSIRDWLDQCFSLIGKNWQDFVRLRKGFKPEYSRLISNPATINSLGWFPVVDFKTLSRMMIDSNISEYL